MPVQNMKHGVLLCRANRTPSDACPSPCMHTTSIHIRISSTPGTTSCCSSSILCRRHHLIQRMGCSSCICHRQTPGYSNTSGLRRAIEGWECSEADAEGGGQRGQEARQMHVLAAEYGSVLSYLAEYVCTAWTE